MSDTCAKVVDAARLMLARQSSLVVLSPVGVVRPNMSGMGLGELLNGCLDFPERKINCQ